MSFQLSRRHFLTSTSLGAGLTFLSAGAGAQEPAIAGFDDKGSGAQSAKVWEPVSDRKIRMGIVGYGVCKFGAAFGLQDHPNVQVVAVSDLVPERCAELAKACRCEKTYPSLEELVKDDTVEAVFVATDAPSHARLCMEVLRHGKHVATAVPATFGSPDEAEELFQTVKETGLKYMMFETSYFHDDLYAMRQLYQAGAFGKLVYAEGQYYHYMETPIDSYKGWRIGLPPQWYPTHSNAYYTGVTNGRFTEVSCLGVPSIIDHLQPGSNGYKNPFGTEVALLRTSDGGTARMTVSWDTPGHEGEVGLVRGQLGAMTGVQFQGKAEAPALDLIKPPLPPTMDPGGHGGSHGYLGNEFVMSILEDRTPLVDITAALNMSLAGVLAHSSALKEGEWMKIPQYTL
jgi:predicted dehydrogenase